MPQMEEYWLKQLSADSPDKCLLPDNLGENMGMGHALVIQDENQILSSIKYFHLSYHNHVIQDECVILSKGIKFWCIFCQRS